MRDRRVEMKGVVAGGVGGMEEAAYGCDRLECWG